MDYSKYYTPPWIAKLLVNELMIEEPLKAVDICCGSCNLLNAVKERWEKTELYGVDIEDHSISGIYFNKQDGREYAINHIHEFPLVVANPPFDVLTVKNEFQELVCGPFAGINCYRLEVEMLFANLLMLSAGGVLLIILPSSIIEAEHHNKLRKMLAEKYNVTRVIRLPDDTFGASKIRSYALIIHNTTANSEDTSFYTLCSEEQGYTISCSKVLSHKKMIKGDWLESGSENIMKNVYDIKRGTISSSFFQDDGQRILHTARNGIDWKPSVRYIANNIKPSICADKGDIIVSRVGKSAGRWYVHPGPSMPISDCLFRLKDPNGDILKNIDGKVYDLQIKGVAAQYITMADFITWINKCKDH